MASSPSSEELPSEELPSEELPSEELPSEELGHLRAAVAGTRGRPGLVRILPLLQMRYRQEIRRDERWSKQELVSHPEPRQLIRAMRKQGNLDAQGRPVYTLDEHRVVTSDIHENQLVRGVVDRVRHRLMELAPDEPEAAALLTQLERARHQARFLLDVSPPGRRRKPPTTTLMQDPLYRAVVALRV
jgi:hypothetical protein